ncbi:MULTISPECIES: hypothetical protein [Yersinia]|jgi:hypothetical protein|uniref:hypothetical protein n=1 Tax=Yersinia TaxID=629 RepID=UPI0005E5F3CA|nr:MULTISPECIES: hypothetical protein [Yersinia]ARB85898.1 hypothetical protein A6J67_19310 [Yersinia sp. FDAARGOS_228]AVL35740.1 hypothetical protein CEQ36_08970 [Yersinia intermedia]MCB5297483.1 hypothetical protein [Yersinia intermedia]MDA5481913.1 hypothetical protein [Yersinia intermedia]MDN0116721.1 hypothetical protein [Yersinia intermedia]
MEKGFQRIGSVSNAHVGHDFEFKVQLFFKGQDIFLKRNYKVMVGIDSIKKSHRFDLGCSEQKILVECKSHRWTTGNNVPSAKLTVWNEAMFYFYLVPTEYRKIMFVLKDKRQKSDETLCQYYVNKFNHLIPTDVELWEYDEIIMDAARIY